MEPRPEAGESVGIVLLGYPADGLVDGRPARNSPPFFFDKMALVPSEWPLRLDANVPVGLHLLVVDGEHSPDS